MSKDIIITLPSKIKWEEYQKELDSVKDGNAVLNFKVSYFPKETDVGCKCYLLHCVYIIGWMKIVGLEENDFTCEVTGRVWKGKFIQRSGDFHQITPIPMKGFQGFRYFN